MNGHLACLTSSRSISSRAGDIRNELTRILHRMPESRRESPLRRSRNCRLEMLESRLAMDYGLAADPPEWRHEPPPIDPGGGTVGQATISLTNDYQDAYFDASTMLYVLSNDRLPDGDPARITAITSRRRVSP